MKSDRRGVASWGLQQRTLVAKSGRRLKDKRGGGGLPLVNVQVARHVGSKTGRGGGAQARLHGKVIACIPLHAEVAKVEVVGAQVGSEQRLGLGQVASVSPGPRNGRGMHGGERRRHFHGVEGYRRTEQQTETSVCGRGLAGEVAEDKAYKTEKLIPI